jgi:hypothetical protein
MPVLWGTKVLICLSYRVLRSSYTCPMWVPWFSYPYPKRGTRILIWLSYGGYLGLHMPVLWVGVRSYCYCVVINNNNCFSEKSSTRIVVYLNYTNSVGLCWRNEFVTAKYAPVPVNGVSVGLGIYLTDIHSPQGLSYKGIDSYSRPIL